VHKHAMVRTRKHWPRRPERRAGFDSRRLSHFTYSAHPCTTSAEIITQSGSLVVAVPSPDQKKLRQEPFISSDVSRVTDVGRRRYLGKVRGGCAADCAPILKPALQGNENLSALISVDAVEIDVAVESPRLSPLTAARPSFFQASIQRLQR
jgi:hypothetical protein